MNFKLLSLFGGLLLGQLQAAPIDDVLHQKLNFFRVFKYRPPVTSADESSQAKVELGRRLFIDPNISGNKNISCRTCHHPMMGTSDNLALSQTEDGKGVLKRNSSSLYNIGDLSNVFMFWDGRVHFNLNKKIFTTPEPALNGDNPQAQNITGVMKSALAAQTIFPLVSHEEMRGKKGDNPIADAKDNLEAWDLIIKRITTEGDTSRYITLFNRAYPETSGSVQKINIGHAGEAMASFLRAQFQSIGSPFHRYLGGDDSAMNEQEKRGLVVFMEKGKCIACHQGSLLGNNTFFASVGVPSFGAKPFVMDRGRGEVSKEPFRDMFFKTPSLINVSLSAPYMHNGAFQTLREVIEHYNNASVSLSQFDISKRKSEFPVEVELLNSPVNIQEIWDSIEARFLKIGLGLTPTERADLEVFLTTGLTDPNWAPQGFFKSKKRF